jgi:23S rRNA (pseudouridine1915-N3)-methyltransferase
MRIAIVSFQRTRNPALEACEEEYLRRLSRHAEVELCPLRRWDDQAGLRPRFASANRRIGLCVEGKVFSSEGLAQRLQALLNQGCSHLVLVIGAAEGMPAGVEHQLEERWSLSRLTFSHQLTRLILLETLYRSFDLLQGGPYHK